MFLKVNISASGGVIASIVIPVRPVQDSKEPVSISVTPLGMVIDDKDVQSEKEELPIYVTLSGIVTEVRLIQP